MPLEVAFRLSAREDLGALAHFIARDGVSRAEAFVSRIEPRCLALGACPEAGRAREDLSVGLRTVAFERRAIIAYVIVGERIEIVRVLYGGRDVAAALRALG